MSFARVKVKYLGVINEGRQQNVLSNENADGGKRPHFLRANSISDTREEHCWETRDAGPHNLFLKEAVGA